MTEQRTIPKFQSEAEEADWWSDNREQLDAEFLSRLRAAEGKRMDRATLLEMLEKSKVGAGRSPAVLTE